MHFGRAIYSVTSGGVLTVISPIDYFFCGIWLCVSLFAAVVLSVKYGIAKPAPWIWNALGTAAILGVATANATVKLDPHAGKVYITRVLFYYPTRETYDLAALQGAMVGASDQSDALQLVFSNGVHTQLTPYTQMDGKNQAAAAINAFVQQHGGTGVEY